MARKAGSISLGFDQVQSMAREAEVAIRIEASDGSADGRGKIRTLSKAMNREYNFADPIVVGCFSSNKIGAGFIPRIDCSCRNKKRKAC